MSVPVCSATIVLIVPVLNKKNKTNDVEVIELLNVCLGSSEPVQEKRKHFSFISNELIKALKLTATCLH